MPERHERGTALMLLPAGLLIVCVLGALAVDTTAAVLARRQLAALTAGIANDAATAALDTERFRADGTYQLDDAAVRAIALDALAAHGTDLAAEATIDEITITTGPDPATPARVTITLTSRSPTVFLRTIPGAPDHTTITATATATAVLSG